MVGTATTIRCGLSSNGRGQNRAVSVRRLVLPPVGASAAVPPADPHGLRLGSETMKTEHVPVDSVRVR